MDTLTKIRNTMKSFEGRRKRLEHDKNVSLFDYDRQVSGMEHDFYNTIKRILENEGTAENISSVDLAKRYGLIDG